MTHWLVTGATGQLGTHLCELLGDAATGLSHAELDITSERAVSDVVRDLRPGVLINAAAHTGVDAAETDEAAAQLVNATAVSYLAESAAACGARFIQVSTDYVFDGTAEVGYEPSDVPAPRTAYGRTKLAGERFARAAGGYVVRTAWVYGGPSANFVDTMLRLARERDTVDVVHDQFGSPTYVRDLSAALIELGTSGAPPGVLHYANSGVASWFDLAQAVFRIAGLDPDRVRPVSSVQFPRPAARPAWSVLSTAAWVAAGLTPPRTWPDALTDYIGIYST